MAERIQRKRTRGWKMPANTVYVGRPTLWGNPWFVAAQPRCGCRNAGCEHQSMFRCETAEDAVKAYRWWIENGSTRRHELTGLRGKNLACWCPLVDKAGNKVPCHADVLLELANA